MAEVAGLDSYQMNQVICRPRDSRGRLIRPVPGMPEGAVVDEEGMRRVGNVAPMESAVRRARIEAGAAPGEVDRLWKEFLAENPKFGKGGV